MNCSSAARPTALIFVPAWIDSLRSGWKTDMYSILRGLWKVVQMSALCKLSA